MNRITAILAVAVMFVAASCNSNKMTEEQIAQFEKTMFNPDWSLNQEIGTQLVAAYCQFADENPKSEKSQNFLFKAVDVAMNLPDVNRSLEVIDKFLTMYPDNEKAPHVLFSKALIYEDRLGDLVNARKYYELFLEKYPENVLARDAQASLKNLGKTPEELIKEFEMMAQ